MTEYNVIIWDFNSKKFVPYNIFPYLLEEYKSLKEKPTTFEDIKKFILFRSMYKWWARCEYEVILSDWPSQSVHEKVDVHFQIKNNVNAITKLFMLNLKSE